MADAADNCPLAPNGDQLDTDGDEIGDTCDGDDDGDSVTDAADNCPLAPNGDQLDTDGDEIGDTCDGDDDGDSVTDAADNCPLTANADQSDLDGDGAGDACEVDTDGDGVIDADDNCLRAINADQADLDGDDRGDVCDPDDDADGVSDDLDVCPRTPDADQFDLDGDGDGDACDSDDDGDSVADDADVCPRAPDPDQLDTDGDGDGDACDGDADGDGVSDVEDGCPLLPDPDQTDTDDDGGGDVCDLDDDGDGVGDLVDGCPLASDPDQTDTDDDGAGDACDDDDDGDGLSDLTDVCPSISDESQGDLDGDGAGDACDSDDDGDGVDDGTDSCATVANSDQGDLDGDGLGNACDRDADGDGFVDTVGFSGGGCQTGGGGGSALGLGLVGMAMWMRRRRARAVAAVCAAVAVPASASADQRGFAVERFQLAGDGNGLLDVEAPRTLAARRLEVSLWLGGADDPLVTYDGETGERLGRLVDLRIGGELGASYGVTRWLEAQATLPFVLFQDRDQMSTAAIDGSLDSISVSGLGDLRLAAKLWALRQGRHGVDLALIPGVTVPTASADAAYLGDGGVSLTPSLAVGRRQGRVRVVLDLGYQSRSRREMGNLVVDDEFALRTGGGVALTPTVELAVTTSIAVPAADPFGLDHRVHAEAMTGVTYQVMPQVQAMAGAGLGLATAYGTPDARLIVAVRYGLPERTVVDRDPDRDGLLATADRCPSVAEDLDGDDDGDGCPEEAAPAAPEAPPVPPDRDGDGRDDTVDGCPGEAEDLDGVADDDGCPDLDDDGDGVAGTDDLCPTEAGVVEHGGCPAPANVDVRDGEIVTLEPVFFATRSAEILERSYGLLDGVAQVLTSRSAMRIRIEGHTDARGGAAFNRTLSQQRAEAVRAYLIGRGIAGDRLEAAGYGEAQPVADNASSEGRAANRRVVFAIIGTSP